MAHNKRIRENAYRDSTTKSSNKQSEFGSDRPLQPQRTRLLSAFPQPLRTNISGLDGEFLHVLVVGDVLLDGVLDDFGGVLAVLCLPLLKVLGLGLLWLFLQQSVSHCSLIHTFVIEQLT